MPGPRGGALLDIFTIGSQLQAAAPLPEDLAYKFAYNPETDSYAPTGEVVKGSVRTTGGLFEGLKTFVTSFGQTVTGSPSSLVGSTLQEVGRQSRTGVAPVVGRVPMGFFDDVFGNDSTGDSFNAGLSSNQSGFDWTALLNTGVNAAGQFLNRSQGTPTQFQSNMAAVPMVIGAGGAVVRTVGGALSARLASLGLNRATAWTLLKQGGPAALITLGLSAAEVASVARSRGGYRRMNMCNGRALRRASRRLEGFHRFYKRTCGLPVARRYKKHCK